MKDSKRLWVVTGVSFILFAAAVIFADSILACIRYIFNLTGRMPVVSIGTPDFILLGFAPLWNYLLIRQRFVSSITIVFQNCVVLVLIAGLCWYRNFNNMHFPVYLFTASAGIPRLPAF
jgi:hypothetical protein